MDKKSLKNGMAVETRHGESFIVVENYLVGSAFKLLTLNDYNDDLTSSYNHDYDIIRVFTFDNPLKCLQQIWERKDIKLQEGDIFMDDDNLKCVIINAYDTDSYDILYSDCMYEENGSYIRNHFRKIGHSDDYVRVVKSIFKDITDGDKN